MVEYKSALDIKGFIEGETVVVDRLGRTYRCLNGIIQDRNDNFSDFIQAKESSCPWKKSDVSANYLIDEN